MEIKSLVKHSTYFTEIEKEGIDYIVVLKETDFAGWEIRITNVDECEEVDDSNPIWDELAEAAENAIYNSKNITE